ncbi:MAG TPA: carboxypeptidase-like regulatory domain-containing protein [Polyangiales bacterium]|nr:carboxypeptidase-like regulatory domain-containing protein [Polyangiales bacterium]
MSWLLLWAAPANAFAEALPAIEQHAEPGLVVGAKLGGGYGKPLNEFGASYVLELELGWLLPLPDPLRHSFELFVAPAYTAPRLEGDVPRDARLPGNGRAHYVVSQRLLTTTAGLLFRLPLPSDRFAPYAALGYRGYWSATQTDGTVAGEDFGENTEYGYAHGLYAAAGLDVFLGPGALLAEFQFAWAPRNAYVLRETNLGAMQLLAGYRLMWGSAASAKQSRAEPAPPPPPAAVPTPAVVEEPPPAEVEPAPAAPTPAGQIRGNVRAFSGQPLAATVSLDPGSIEVTADERGEFRLDVAPGSYTVQLRARGYRTQTRTITVDDNGVTVLNVELRKQ